MEVTERYSSSKTRLQFQIREVVQGLVQVRWGPATSKSWRMPLKESNHVLRKEST